MIPMAMAPRGRDEHGHPVEPLQGGEIKHELPIGPGFWEGIREAAGFTQVRRSPAKIGRAQ